MAKITGDSMDILLTVSLISTLQCMYEKECINIVLEIVSNY
jgi:hypothetical protein